MKLRHSRIVQNWIRPEFWINEAYISRLIAKKITKINIAEMLMAACSPISGIPFQSEIKVSAFILHLSIYWLWFGQENSIYSHYTAITMRVSNMSEKQ